MWDTWTKIRILRGAADHVIGAGLLKGAYTEENSTRRCTVSALRHVALRQGRLASTVEHEASDMLELMVLVAKFVAPEEYARHVGIGTRFAALTAITQWNDDPDRTAEDVSKALRQLADSLAGA